MTIESPELAPVHRWLEGHSMKVDSLTAIGDKSIALQVRIPGGDTRTLHLSLELLGAFNAEQLIKYFETKNFAAALQKDDVYITHPAG